MKRRAANRKYEPGQVINGFELLEPRGKKWLVKCLSCNDTMFQQPSNLQRRTSNRCKRCKQYSSEPKPSKNRKHFPGQIINGFTLVAPFKSAWIVRCRCGKEVTVNLPALKNRKTDKCRRCLSAERNGLDRRRKNSEPNIDFQTVKLFRRNLLDLRVVQAVERTADRLHLYLPAESTEPKTACGLRVLADCRVKPITLLNYCDACPSCRLIAAEIFNQEAVA